MTEFYRTHTFSQQSILQCITVFLARTNFVANLREKLHAVKATVEKLCVYACLIQK